METISLASTFETDPNPLYERWRQQGDIIWDAEMRGYLVLSYELSKHIEEREDLYRHPYSDATEVLLDIKGGPRNITVLQGEEHKKLRRYLGQMFIPKRVQEYSENHIQPILNFLMERIVPNGHADLAYELADQLPPRVFMSLLGLDWKNQGLVDRELELHNTIMHWVGGVRTRKATQAARDASHELNAILAPQVRKSRTQPGEDMVSRLWAEAPEVFSEVSEEDILAIGRELFLAGSDTSVLAIANAFYLLLTQPDVLAAVNADRVTALNNFIEESLRLIGVVQYRFRVANQDCELGGVQIKRNDLLIPINAAANVDPARYSCPHQVDLNRNQPRDHLAFNKGPRVCVGAPLARAELRAVIEALLDRLPNVRLDPNKPAPKLTGSYTRSYRPLHVLFDPAPR